MKHLDPGICFLLLLGGLGTALAGVPLLLALTHNTELAGAIGLAGLAISYLGYITLEKPTDALKIRAANTPPVSEATIENRANLLSEIESQQAHANQRRKDKDAENKLRQQSHKSIFHFLGRHTWIVLETTQRGQDPFRRVRCAFCPKTEIQTIYCGVGSGMSLAPDWHWGKWTP